MLGNRHNVHQFICVSVSRSRGLGLGPVELLRKCLEGRNALGPIPICVNGKDHSLPAMAHLTAIAPDRLGLQKRESPKNIPGAIKRKRTSLIFTRNVACPGAVTGVLGEKSGLERHNNM